MGAKLLIVMVSLVVLVRVALGILYASPVAPSSITSAGFAKITFGGVPDFSKEVNALLIFFTNFLLFVGVSDFFGGGVVGGIIATIAAGITATFAFLF